MSSSYNGTFAIVIEEEMIKRLHLEEFDLFYKTLDDLGIRITDIAFDFSLDDYESLIYAFDEDAVAKRDRVVEAYNALLDAFKAKTGFDIKLNYHDSDAYGSGYDEVDGPFWNLLFEDVYQLTPEAKKLKQTVPFEIKHFVEFG